MITKLGGDIQLVKHSNMGNLYTLRLLIKGLDGDKELSLRKFLEKGNDFSSIQIGNNHAGFKI